MVVSAQKVRAAAAGGAGQWGRRGRSPDGAPLACEPWDEWPHCAALGLGSYCSEGTGWAEMAQGSGTVHLPLKFRGEGSG